MSVEKFQSLKCKLRECSLIAGLHPDQSTDYIIDYALKTKKPFAVIPCCLHSKQFSGKKNAKRQAIRDFDALLDYYKQKAPGHIFSKVLDFDGRNTVIYGNLPVCEKKIDNKEEHIGCCNDATKLVTKEFGGLPRSASVNGKSTDGTDTVKSGSAFNNLTKVVE